MRFRLHSNSSGVEKIKDLPISTDFLIRNMELLLLFGIIYPWREAVIRGRRLFGIRCLFGGNTVYGFIFNIQRDLALICRGMLLFVDFIISLFAYISTCILYIYLRLDYCQISNKRHILKVQCLLKGGSCQWTALV